MTASQANELEAWFATLPSPVPDVLHEPYTWFDEALRMIAGDPQALVDAGVTYAALGQQVTALATQDRTDVAALAGLWQGEAYDAFAARMAALESELDTIAAQLAAMPEVLGAGATACVEGANLIVELVVALVVAVVSTFLLDLALAAITFGASMAAWAAETLAEAAVGLARAAQVVEKVAAVLVKVAEVLERVAVVLQRVATVVKEQREVLAAVEAASKGWWRGGPALGARAEFAALKWVLGKEVWAATGGAVSIPGILGPLRATGNDGVDAYGAASDAVEAADRARSGG